MTTLFILAWLSSFVILATIAFVRQSRYTDLLAKTYPDTGYGRLRLERDGPVMAWDAVRSIRQLQHDKHDEMPAPLLLARLSSLDAWRAAIVSMVGGAILTIVVVTINSAQHPPNPGVAAALTLILAFAMAVTSTITAAAIRVPWPGRLKYVAGASLSLVATILIAWMLAG